MNPRKEKVCRAVVSPAHMTVRAAAMALYVPMCAVGLFVGSLYIGGRPAGAIGGSFSWSLGTYPIDTSGLATVSCASPTFCVAVGNHNAHVFNGARWSSTYVDSSSATLSSVSCASSSFCMAGDSSGNVFNFNGSIWSGASQASTSKLTSMSCPSATFCMAISSQMAVSFNGSTWSPSPSSPSNVSWLSCPTTSFCVAAGHDSNDGGAVSVFNGSTWSAAQSIEPFNDNGGLPLEVSCVSATFCVSVDLKGYEETYNGSIWTAPQVIDASHLYGVSCTSSTFCVAIDGNGYLTYNGTVWSTPALIDSGNDSFTSIQCVSAGFCMAASPDGVATWGTSTAVPQPAVSGVNPSSGTTAGGTAVTITGSNLTSASQVMFGSTPAPRFTVVSPTSVTAVSPPEASSMVDVTVTTPAGTSPVSTSDPFTFTSSPPATTWNESASLDSTNFLESVSCASTSLCAAVDNKGNAVTYNGTAWSSPSPVAPGQFLNGVSCPTSSMCVAVGGVSGAQAPSAAVAMVTANGGSSWSAETLPSGTPELRAVSCADASHCWAVGFNEVQSDTPINIGIVATSNGGATWTAQSVPSAVSVAGAGLVGISCANAMDCWAVSGVSANAGPGMIIATTTGGQTWTAQTVPSGVNPAGGYPLYFSGISCASSTGCSASIAGSGPLEVANTVDGGTTWTLQPIANPTDTFGVITGISCTGTSNCTAVGDVEFDIPGQNAIPLGLSVSGTSAGSWSAPAGIEPGVDLSFHGLISISCVNTSFCVAVDGNGDAMVYGATSPPPPTAGPGYWMMSSAGSVYNLGSAVNYGSAAPAVIPSAAMAATPDGKGYWIVSATGTVTTFGDAASYILHPQPSSAVVSIAATKDGKGIWVATSGGQVCTAGAAPLFGDLSSTHLNASIVDMAVTPDGGGYWLLGGDGGVFTFGDAGFFGSTGSIHLNAPAVAMAPTATGMGYWFVASDGGIFTYGDAGFFGSMGSTPLAKPVNGMVATATSKGYWLAASDGGVFAFGDAGFVGSLGGQTLPAPIVGFAR